MSLLLSLTSCAALSLFFFFNDTATTEIYTLSLHDALPISHASDPKGRSLIMSDVARILIAEDEETFLQSMGALLRREGYACDCVRAAGEAAAALVKEAYDLLITSTYMPRNAGLRLRHYLQS